MKEKQSDWTQLYEKYAPKIRRFPGSKVQHHSVWSPEDIVQEVFTRGINAGPDEVRPAWLGTIAANLVIDLYKRKDYLPYPSIEVIRANHLEAQKGLVHQPPNGDPIEARRVREAVNGLTEDQRRVIELKFWDGLTNNEVAQIIGKTEGAVKSLQHRALEALRRDL